MASEHEVYGMAAVMNGTPDVGQNGTDAEGTETDAGDAIANILHWVAWRGGDPEEALRKGKMHFENEKPDEDVCPSCGSDKPYGQRTFYCPDEWHKRKAEKE